ncbi:MAG: hypothetical protein Tsb0013_13820 [Phycisphaerales bacterium]
MNSIGGQRVDELLASIGAKTPAPGGGAVTGLVGAVGAALAQMVVAYSVGSKKLESHRPALEQAAERLRDARDQLLALADADAQAYAHYNALEKDDPQRPSAALACIRVPLDVIDTCARLMDLCRDLAPISNRYLRSDLAIAAILTEAVARASMCNVRINLPLVADGGLAASSRERGEAGLARCAERLAGVLEACA